MAMSSETFGEMLKRLRESRPGRVQGNQFVPTQLKMSREELARRAKIDARYIKYLEAGEKHRPTREIVLAMAKGMQLTPAETDRFLFAAGLAPLTDYQQLYEHMMETMRGLLNGEDGRREESRDVAEAS